MCHDVTTRRDTRWHDMTRRNVTTWHDMEWHDVTWRDVKWIDVKLSDITWHVVAWCDMKWHYVTWHDVTQLDVTWRDMTWSEMTRDDVTWREMRWNDVTWCDMTRHDVTRREMMWHDTTWRVILISTQQEWILPHVRWLRYCQKTIETFLCLNLSTDIYTLCSCIDKCQKDKKVEAHQNWVGKIVLNINWPVSDPDLNAPRMNSFTCMMAEILSKNY